ncbi:hypothetical protein BZG36_03141 [Bifiguratus adelaidae]|uniref:G-protein coupled receptors family 3 profile domain-containing protein n=1 Tax=Bifiguratus adelaidae TaxID=1938954 RepID=A0A261XX85_9FUNG|nr:hypothetical protein BZG36_03141 [Bifiguratus adelaidae]
MTRYQQIPSQDEADIHSVPSNLRRQASASAAFHYPPAPERQTELNDAFEEISEQEMQSHESQLLSTTSLSSAEDPLQSDREPLHHAIDVPFIPVINRQTNRPATLPVTNDGVFANMSAKPEREGDKDDDVPPAYESAVQDATPPYWQTTVIAPPGLGDIILVEGMPVGNIMGFLWTMIVSMSFQFVGFLLTYLLHSTHAGKNGSKAGLGISLVQYGFYIRSHAPSLSEDYSDDGSDSSNSSDDKNTINANNDYIAYFLMIIGWFIVIKSVVDYMKAKRMERIISSQSEETIPTNSTATFNVGLLLPDENSTTIDATDRYVLTGALAAIQLAVDEVNNNNEVPGVRLNTSRYVTNTLSTATEIFVTEDIIQNPHINAVIGDMYSNMTLTSALMTSARQIPQCSFISSASALSDKSLYPYLFRTLPTSSAFGASLVNFMHHMNWTRYALLYSEDDVGIALQQSTSNQAAFYNMTVYEALVYNMTDNSQIMSALGNIQNSTMRVIVLAEVDAAGQVAALSAAHSMGMMSQNYVWLTINPVWQQLADSVGPFINDYNGLLMIQNTPTAPNSSASAAFNNAYMQLADQNPRLIKDTSYNQPNAYSCLKLLAQGMNNTLQNYPGGRQAGIAALASGTFNKSMLTPSAFNTGWYGPAGNMTLDSNGDVVVGYYQILQLVNNNSIIIANLVDSSIIMNATPVWHDGTHKTPSDSPMYDFRNIEALSPEGLVIIILSGICMTLSLAAMIVVIWYRKVKVIRASSPLFLCLELLGLTIAFSIPLFSLNFPSTAICIVREFLFPIAFILVIGNIVAKNFRIYRIFNNVFATKRAYLSDAYLLKMLAVLLIISLVPITVFMVVWPHNPTVIALSPTSYCYVCWTSRDLSPSGIGLAYSDLWTIIVDGVLLLMAVVLGFKTKNVGAKWSEAKEIAFITYIILIASLISLPTFFLNINTYIVTFYIRFICLYITGLVVLGALLIPKIAQLLQHKCSLKHQAPPTISYRDTGSQSFSNLLSDDGVGFTSTLGCHEGLLPCKKERHYSFLSVWELKRVVVVPSKRFFILLNPKSFDATSYYYTECRPIRGEGEQYMFKVYCTGTADVLFQVRDALALERWIDWFNSTGYRGKSSTSHMSPTHPLQLLSSRDGEDEDVDRQHYALRNVEKAHHQFSPTRSDSSNYWGMPF